MEYKVTNIFISCIHMHQNNTSDKKTQITDLREKVQ